jgi:hypothetical protein
MEPERCTASTPDIATTAAAARVALEPIIGRIPTGWGRTVDCGPGWTELLLALDAALAEICPTYVVHQVKEKFGGLRYYVSVPEPAELACCAALRSTLVAPPWPARSDVEQAAVAAHTAAWAEHDATAEHVRADAELEPVRARRHADLEAMAAIISQFEQRCAATCERCGAPGGLYVQNGWYKTLDAACADTAWVRVRA